MLGHFSIFNVPTIPIRNVTRYIEHFMKIILYATKNVSHAKNLLKKYLNEENFFSLLKLIS